MILDLFAGCGGWAEGIRNIDTSLHDMTIGLELDTMACSTSQKAGHNIIQTDVTTFPTIQIKKNLTGLIASPPCQDFSKAGQKKGLQNQRAHLIFEIPKWAEQLNPLWIAAEQVPHALPIFKAFTHELKKLGYTTWAGKLNAADYGVPQTRIRSILLAHKDPTKAQPPQTTHCQNPNQNLLTQNLKPWITMEQALNPHITTPHWIVNTGCAFKIQGNRDTAHTFNAKQKPALTITGKTNAQWQIDRSPTGYHKLLEQHTLILQSFPPNYPLQGTHLQQRQQLGNAIPPLLAQHIIQQLATP